MTSRVSPGAELEPHLVRADRLPAVGDRMPEVAPRSTASGRSQPRYGPRNASREVSKPAGGSEHAKNAKWLRRSRYSVMW